MTVAISRLDLTPAELREAATQMPDVKASRRDPKRTRVTVQKVTNAAPKLRVETVGALSSQTIRQLGLEAGQALDLTS